MWGRGYETSFLQKRNQNQSWRCDSDQVRYPQLKFDGVAFKKLEGLCVGILKFFPKKYFDELYWWYVV